MENHSLQVNTAPTFHVDVVTTPAPVATDDEVIVKVDWSAVNYKDALAQTEKGGVIRNYPMTPGIDLAGTVSQSQDANFPTGTEVLVTGYGLGVSHPGGYSQWQRVPAAWLVKRPTTLSAKEAMIFGTAGFTAALAVRQILAQTTPADPILITGASGGVGSLALAMLAAKGYHQLIAVSRKESARQWLSDLGASQVIPPSDLISERPRPLAKQAYAGIIDTVGGELVSQILPYVAYGGIVALCGNAGGIKLNTTVLPFILRGITLAGIDSVNTPMPLRQEIWQQLAANKQILEKITIDEISLEEVPTIAANLLAGTHSGRTIVKL